MNTNGLYGYDDSEVIHFIDQVSSYTANILDYLTVDMQRNFIGPMAENWVCKEAQDFFSAFKERDERLAIEIRDRRDEIIKFVSEAANVWVKQTGSSMSFVISDSSGYIPTVDVSGVRENVDGIRGINMKNVPEIMNTLVSIIDKTKNDISYIKELTLGVPFFGGDQQEKFVQLIDIMSNKIIDGVTEFINQSKFAIDNTLVKYGDTAAMVSQKLYGN